MLKAVKEGTVDELSSKRFCKGEIKATDYPRLLSPDTFVGIMKRPMVPAPNSVLNILINAVVGAGFVPKVPAGLLEACF